MQVAMRLGDPDAIVLTEADEQDDALLEHTIPGVTIGKLEVLIFAGRLLAKQDVSWIFASKAGGRGQFEGTSQEHPPPVYPWNSPLNT
jgi:hypothetical protein